MQLPHARTLMITSAHTITADLDRDGKRAMVGYIGPTRELGTAIHAVAVARPAVPVLPAPPTVCAHGTRHLMMEGA